MRADIKCDFEWKRGDSPISSVNINKLFKTLKLINYVLYFNVMSRNIFRQYYFISTSSKYIYLYILYLEEVLLAQYLQSNLRRDLVESLEYAPVLWSYTVQFSSIYTFVTWRWPTVAETCRRQHNKVGYKTVVFWHTPPPP